MRIISGIHRGRKLYTPRDDTIRPTSDKMREAMFNILVHGEYKDRLVDGHVLDVCCGSGALGLEALSRGAAHCTFIDSSKQAAVLTQKNIAHLDEEARSNVLHTSATHLMPGQNHISLLLMDPPYTDADIVPQVLCAQHTKSWLAQGSVCCIEQPVGRVPEFPEAYEVMREKKYGKSILWVLNYTT